MPPASSYPVFGSRYAPSAVTVATREHVLNEECRASHAPPPNPLRREQPSAAVLVDCEEGPQKNVRSRGDLVGLRVLER